MPSISWKRRNSRNFNNRLNLVRDQEGAEVQILSARRFTQLSPRPLKARVQNCDFLKEKFENRLLGPTILCCFCTNRGRCVGSNPSQDTYAESP